MNNNKPRVRFAPSPTGFMHIGNFRSALYDYLFAQKNGGDFILRIEDTDRKRFVEGALESLLKTLEWSEVQHNEGVMLAPLSQSDFAGLRNNVITGVGTDIPTKESSSYPGVLEVGDKGPYIQSEKLEIYKKYAEQLVKDGHAYYCFCEPERLEEMRKDQTALKQAPIYDRYCLNNVTPEEVNEKLKSNCPFVIRLKMPTDETIEFEDMVRGKVKFETSLVDDTVLMKSDGFPTYHLANVIDDHEMGITHVIRGEEWLSSVPKHLLLYRYLGWEAPTFAHLPLLLNADRTKLSKRQGDVAVEDYVKKGYLKEAIINFVAFLGWNPGKGETQEIFTLSELAQRFELKNVHKAGAVFDLKKLDWMNGEWIKKISLQDLYARSLKFLQEKDFFIAAEETKKNENFLKKILSIERTRLLKLSEVGEETKFAFLENLNYDQELLRWKEMEDSELKKSLAISFSALEKANEKDFDFDPEKPENNSGLETIKSALMKAAEENFTDKNGKTDRGKLLWPLRVALTGEKHSPSPFEALQLLGREESLQRIQKAMGK